MSSYNLDEIEIKCILCIMKIEKNAAKYFDLLSKQVEKNTFSLVLKYISNECYNHYITLKNILLSVGVNPEKNISLKKCHKYIGNEGINILKRYKELIEMLSKNHKVALKELYYLLKDEIEIDKINGINIFGSIMYEIYKNIVHDTELKMIFNIMSLEKKTHEEILKTLLDEIKILLKENDKEKNDYI